MDLAFSEEQDMLREAVRGLCDDAVDSVRALEDDPVGYDHDFWQGLAAMGLTGLMLPADVGGSEMGLLDAVVVYEELGRSLVPSPHFVSSVVAAGVLDAAGSDDQRSTWLPRIASGEAVLSVAWLEPDSGSGPTGVRLPATPAPDGEGFALTGLKRHVPFASSAERLIVPARVGDGPEEVDLFLVDPMADGVTLTLQRTVAGDTQYRVDLDGVRVGDSDRIGDAGTGWATLSTVLQDAMVLVAAQAVGGAEAAHALTTAYAKERHQFDKPIGSFQSISHYLADGITAIDGARTLVHRAAWTRDEGRDAATLAPMAKLFATATCRDVTGVAIQVHGGMGFTVECDAQLYFRRAKSWQLNWVDDTRLEELIAATILD
ncbi:MAG: acyl-CoA dehydrogenase family protein [Actinomycetota bacterium]|nr:acyl-CoA dehydrogenase family protein [Actinomycetota bacterium]MEC9394539.1 acyl-CoA dehydrogenase family protein [Actinomycetota bacterium]MEE2958920.1 acyl-CoA dehydrogenase family protein [Actinomycetota bacterium]